MSNAPTNTATPVNAQNHQRPDPRAQKILAKDIHAKWGPRSPTVEASGKKRTSDLISHAQAKYSLSSRAGPEGSHRLGERPQLLNAEAAPVKSPSRTRGGGFSFLPDGGALDPLAERFPKPRRDDDRERGDTRTAPRRRAPCPGSCTAKAAGRPRKSFHTAAISTTMSATKDRQAGQQEDQEDAPRVRQHGVGDRALPLGARRIDGERRE